MGRRRKAAGRAIDGILLLDKPPGLSSNQALQRVRRALNAAKGGHTGSLDPFATGMLPLCFGEATKFSQFLLDADKAYEAEAVLGSATATGDPEGDVVESAAVPPLSDSALAEALASLTGPIDQRPPMYSALKHQGRRLYQLAREGQTVERPPRRVRIHTLELMARGADWLRLSIRCSKGTYIRVLVEDLARALGTVGHTRALRRTGVAPFDNEPMVGIEEPPEVLEAALLPVDAGLAPLPARTLDAAQAEAMRCGRPVSAGGVSGTCRIYDQAARFLGVARADEGGELRPLRLVATG